MPVKSALLLLVLMLLTGVLYGITFHSAIMPLFGGQFFHCTVMGLIFGGVNFLIAIHFFRQINKLKDANNYLNENLRVDGLTGLMNRRAFDNDIQRFKENDTYAVVFLDIDNFRNFNNKYGHSIGDLLLKKVGYVIKLTIKEGDLAYRYGGEEIVIILPGQVKKDSYILAEKIRSSIANLVNTPYPPISVSIGVAHSPEDGKNIKEVIDAGDHALLQAKASGKNRTIAFDSGRGAEM